MSERNVNPDNIYTADGVKIFDGLIVWDYDMRRGIVDLKNAYSKSSQLYGWDGWFQVHAIGEDDEILYPGSYGKLMNDVRVRVNY